MDGRPARPDRAGSRSATTDADGVAACSVASLAGPLGDRTLSAGFQGDRVFGPSAAEATLVAFAFPDTGGFVVGDAAIAPGTSVTWYGAQWHKDNRLRSGEEPPAAFKGFAQTLSAAPATAGATWSTPTDVEPVPPAIVPSHMGVLVASTITKPGDRVTGDVARIAVVRTDAGYSPVTPRATGTVLGFAD